MPDSGPLAVRARRTASIWTFIHPVFALGQLLAFVVSVGLLFGYFAHAVPFHVVHISVLAKIALMIGAVITGALWERDVFGFYWFAPEFLFEDVMTLIVFILQMTYLAMVFTHPTSMGFIVAVLCVAYAVYLGNVAQYIHRTQRMKKEAAEAEATIVKKAA